VLVTDLVIPDTVTTVKSNVFSGATCISSVTIPSSVTAINSNAFNGCTNLTRVNTSSLEAWCKISFGNEAANPLYYAHDLYVNNVLAEALDIPNTVTGIKPYAFRNVSAESVTMADSVTNIGSYAFSGSAIKSVTIPDSVTVMDSYAFGYCNSLTEINIGSGLTTLANYVFYNCTALESIKIPDNITSIGYAAVSMCTSLKDIDLGHGVRTLNTNAFQHSYALEKVVIPNNVTSIGGGVFADCYALKTVVIGANVTSIGSSAFTRSSAITDYYCFKGTRGDTFWGSASTKHYIGDMNSDGDIEIDDYGIIKTFLAGENTQPVSAEQQILADYNLDTAIDAFDLFYIDKAFNESV
jgi:hypothetical protein